MKKIFVGTLLVILTLVFSACGANKIDLMLDNIAEVRYNVFSGENEEYTATFMSGERENPYIVNGICEDKTEFGMLTIKYKSTDMPMVAQYKLIIDEQEYNGNLEYNNYEGTLMVDINKVVNDNASISLAVITNQGESECQLNAKTDNLEITWRSALEIAVSEWGNELDEYISKGKLNGEIYIKIITDLNSNFDTYYWYVSIVGNNGNTNGVIIDPQSGEVIAKN